MKVATGEPPSPGLEQALASALAIGTLPDVHWLHGDDLCSCTFQRIGEWTNPYLAQTLRVRLCCIWRELYKQYPQFVQEVDAFYDGNRHAWATEPQPWNSEEMDMPLYLWYRQLARESGKSLAQIRAEYAGREHERPKAQPMQVAALAPTETELAAAREAKLRATGWIVGVNR